MTDIWLQTGTGRALDLMSPQAGMVDLLTDVAEALAREPRFGGHVRSGAYSVAQHMCLGGDCILAETGSIAIARAFHLHDAHEYACKDITTPLAAALAARCGQVLAHYSGKPDSKRLLRTGAAVFRAALRGQKRDLDAAIHAAAGHPWPLAEDVAHSVHAWDMRMLQAERRQLLGDPPLPWDAYLDQFKPAATGRITVWPWPRAADEWRSRLVKLFPHLAPDRRAA